MKQTGEIILQQADVRLLHDLPPSHRQWLCNSDSLTKRLYSEFSNKVSFQLRRAAWDSISEEERLALKLTRCQHHWVREIDWHYRGQTWITARVIIPEGNKGQQTQQLLEAGNASIGDILFGEKQFKRNTMEIAKLPVSHPYYQLAQNQEKLMADYFWGRRSVFCRGKEKLLVSEIFLPAFFDFI